MPEVGDFCIALRERFPAAQCAQAGGWWQITGQSADWHALLAWCRSEWDFNYLASLTAVHYIDNHRMQLVTHLFQIVSDQPLTRRAVVKVDLPDEAPAIDSVSDVWPAADWHEREVYDLFGVRFNGHPDLRRILMEEDYDGHPLRKDFKDRKPNLGVGVETLEAEQ